MRAARERVTAPSPSQALSAARGMANRVSTTAAAFALPPPSSAPSQSRKSNGSAPPGIPAPRFCHQAVALVKISPAVVESGSSAPPATAGAPIKDRSPTRETARVPRIARIALTMAEVRAGAASAAKSLRESPLGACEVSAPVPSPKTCAWSMLSSMCLRCSRTLDWSVSSRAIEFLGTRRVSAAAARERESFSGEPTARSVAPSCPNA